MKKLKLIDLYAGIGGIRLGFGKNKCESVFSSEWDKFAQQTYESNFGEAPMGDITLISEKDIPRFDILLAGFPCQPFSQAGKKMGFSHVASGPMVRSSYHADIQFEHDMIIRESDNMSSKMTGMS